jgi:hypothetical protein
MSDAIHARAIGGRPAAAARITAELARTCFLVPLTSPSLRLQGGLLGGGATRLRRSQPHARPGRRRKPGLRLTAAAALGPVAVFGAANCPPSPIRPAGARHPPRARRPLSGLCVARWRALRVIRQRQRLRGKAAPRRRGGCSNCRTGRLFALLFPDRVPGNRQAR